MSIRNRYHETWNCPWGDDPGPIASVGEPDGPEESLREDHAHECPGCHERSYCWGEGCGLPLYVRCNGCFVAKEAG